MYMDIRELVDLVAAWLILGVAFANLLSAQLFSVRAIEVALLTAGIGFLLHELAHRAVARNFGLHARFQAFYRMLAFAFALSFFGFIFAAPGAVYTTGNRTDREQMLISVAGPVTNIVLAFAFLFVPGIIGQYGFRINAWLALFNMIPFGGLDGQSVYRYSQPVFFLVGGVAAVLVFLF